jgi:hypothetical protein
MVTCRHCGDSFNPLPGKPGFINECPSCLNDRGIFAPSKNVCPPHDPSSPPFVTLHNLPLTIRYIQAHFKSSCRVCHQPIHVGSFMLWDLKTKGKWHEECFHHSCDSNPEWWRSGVVTK